MELGAIPPTPGECKNNMPLPTTSGADIPIERYRNKQPELVCEELRDAGYDDAAIANILVNRLGMKKTPAAKLIWPNEQMEDSSFIKRINKALDAVVTRFEPIVKYSGFAQLQGMSFHF